MPLRPSPTPLALLLALVPLALSSACADRTIADAGDEDLEPGDQPQAAGALYAPCTASSDCPDGLCVFPSGEAGYCSVPCLAPGDPAPCEPAPGDQSPGCLDIGLPGGELVCALDCGADPCPRGMRCERVMARGGAGRSICF